MNLTTFVGLLAAVDGDNRRTQFLGCIDTNFLNEFPNTRFQGSFDRYFPQRDISSADGRITFHGGTNPVVEFKPDAGGTVTYDITRERTAEFLRSLPCPQFILDLQKEFGLISDVRFYMMLNDEKLDANLTANTRNDIKKVIQLATTTLPEVSTLSLNVQEFKESLITFVASIQEQSDGLTNTINELNITIASFTTNLNDELTQKLGSLKDDLSNLVKDTRDESTSIMLTTASNVSSTLNSASANIEGRIDNAANRFSTIVNQLVNTIANSTALYQSYLNKMDSSIKDWVKLIDDLVLVQPDTIHILGSLSDAIENIRIANTMLEQLSLQTSSLAAFSVTGERLLQEMNSRLPLASMTVERLDNLQKILDRTARVGEILVAAKAGTSAIKDLQSTRLMEKQIKLSDKELQLADLDIDQKKTQTLKGRINI